MAALHEPPPHRLTGRGLTRGASLMPDVPYGFCYCGCGKKTKLIAVNSAPQGIVKGEPRQFLKGHHFRKEGPRYLEEDRGFETPCWIWQLFLPESGYGQDYVNGRRFLAHRRYFELVFGPIPKGLELDHLCRVPACVNPAHLEAVTHAENVRRSLNTKLTVERSREIKRLHAAGGRSLRSLAAEFSIDQSQVWRIVHGKAWKS